MDMRFTHRVSLAIGVDRQATPQTANEGAELDGDALSAGHIERNAFRILEATMRHPHARARDGAASGQGEAGDHDVVGLDGQAHECACGERPGRSQYDWLAGRAAGGDREGTSASMVAVTEHDVIAWLGIAHGSAERVIVRDKDFPIRRRNRELRPAGVPGQQHGQWQETRC